MKRFKVTAFGVPDCQTYFKVIKFFESYAALNEWLDQIELKMPANCYFKGEEL